METVNRCVVLLCDGDVYSFLGPRGEHAPVLSEACIFDTELSARRFIERHGLDRISSVRRLRSQDNCEHKNKLQG